MADLNDLRFPEEWHNAELVWESVEKVLPPQLPDDCREQIQRDVYALIHRLIGTKPPSASFVYAGPQACAEPIQKLGDSIGGLLAELKGQITTELIGLQVQVSLLEARLDRLDGHTK